MKLNKGWITLWHSLTGKPLSHSEAKMPDFSKFSKPIRLIFSVATVDTYDEAFKEKYGNGETDYIKMREVKWNSTVIKFALTYYNNLKKW